MQLGEQESIIRRVILTGIKNKLPVSKTPGS